VPLAPIGHTHCTRTRVRLLCGLADVPQPHGVVGAACRWAGGGHAEGGCFSACATVRRSCCTQHTEGRPTAVLCARRNSLAHARSAAARRSPDARMLPSGLQATRSASDVWPRQQLVYRRQRQVEQARAARRERAHGRLTVTYGALCTCACSKPPTYLLPTRAWRLRALPHAHCFVLRR
jgi:hypothetical protein